MRHIPGKGMGLIATSHIHRGDLIMANTPSLMIDYRAFNELTKPQYMFLQAAAVAHLPPAHAAHLLALSAHVTDTSHLTREELVDKISATNGFDIDPDDEDPDRMLCPTFSHLDSLAKDAFLAQMRKSNT